MYLIRNEISKIVKIKYCIIKWQVNASASVLLIRKYTNTKIIHTNKRAMLIASVLKTNSLDFLSPLVSKAFAPIVLKAKKIVGIQKWQVLK